MQTHSLAKTGDDDYNSLEGWLRQEGVTSPPLWLSDLLGSKPLQDRLWFAPQGDIDGWVDNIENEDFLAELGLINGDGSINVGGHHDTRSRTFMSSVRVHTALVSPVTAGALVRALQTVDGPWLYRLPAAEDDFEINASPYKLVGWLTEVTRDSGIDERDPLRYEVRTIESRPSRKTEKALNLRAVYDGQTRWIDANDKKTVFVYSAWSDSRGDEREDELRYDETVRSDGWHLRIDKEALTNLLNKMGLDMIVEVEITRRNRSYGNYSRYNEEKEQEKENRFDKLILLRRDGTIEAAEGCLGTWATPRS